MLASSEAITDLDNTVCKGKAYPSSAGQGLRHQEKNHIGASPENVSIHLKIFNKKVTLICLLLQMLISDLSKHALLV